MKKLFGTDGVRGVANQVERAAMVGQPVGIDLVGRGLGGTKGTIGEQDGPPVFRGLKQDVEATLSADYTGQVELRADRGDAEPVRQDVRRDALVRPQQLSKVQVSRQDRPIRPAGSSSRTMLGFTYR